MNAAEKIRLGKIYLGIELGSTRIKASLIDDTFLPIASGEHCWENRFENGFWTYSLDDIHFGIQQCYANLAENTYNQYSERITTLSGLGVSAMMHGYMAFDKNGRLLVPFRTWRNTTTEKAAAELTELLQFNIPQRWSISHLYQAILNNEEHLGDIAYINTLAGYIHMLLTGHHEVGIGEASGIFPIDKSEYNQSYLMLCQKKFAEKGFCKNLEDILPKVKTAGFAKAQLTEEGAAFLDISGNLKSSCRVCPPEGDAGTGMVATNSIREKTGNISAGTSIFSMLVLQNNLSGYYPQIDVVTTPSGAPVAMVHCNNCCGELDAWVNIFGEFASLCGVDLNKSELYNLLYTNALRKNAGANGICAFNFISAEPVADVPSGHPMYYRTNEGDFNLGSFFGAQLYSAFATLKLGMDILFTKENVKANAFTGHGGLFKVKGVAQQILSDALDTDIITLNTAAEGGAWGMALLAAYMDYCDKMPLCDFLDNLVFAKSEICLTKPDADGKRDFDLFMKNYKKGLCAQRAI